MRWLRTIIYVVVALIIVVIATGWYLLAGSKAQRDGTINVAALSAPVTITRDHIGVVTIDAANRRDLAWATGFVHAQERFFQMDLQRRLAAGELAALLGPVALKADLNHRRHRFRERAEHYVQQLPPRQHRLFDAYRDGVNAGLEHLRVRPWEYLLLGTKPEPWRDADTLLTL
ncbi:MAG TPA: penicillin acylase family protein, partial [Oleiagrimonas sp.]|nr:penicillin acylase family protein [Oleiagrimonas sp.]